MIALGCRKEGWKVLDPAVEFGFEKSAMPMLGLTKYWSEKLQTKQLRLGIAQRWHIPGAELIDFPTRAGMALNSDPSTHHLEPYFGGGAEITPLSWLSANMNLDAFGNRLLDVSEGLMRAETVAEAWRPRGITSAGIGSRFTLFASGSSSLMRAMPSFTVLPVPPVSWMVKACS